MNKEKTLIEVLRGEVINLKEIDKSINDINLFDENNIVEMENLMALLSVVNEIMAISKNIFENITMSLSDNSNEIESEILKKDDGKSLTGFEILKLCELRDNILYLPKIQLNKKSYQEAKKYIENAGGRWEGGKTQGFTFTFNAERVFSILKDGKEYNLQKEYQFFETPESISDWIVSLSGEIKESDTILEPSAGMGSIIRAIHRVCQNVHVDCYELMPENIEYLLTIPNVHILGDDFLQTSLDKKYTKIIANPPFSKNQDIEHIMKMYALLEEDGILVSILSTHWNISNEKKCLDFKEWIKDVDGFIYDINKGEFKDSGTNIGTNVLVINKKSFAL